MDFNYTKDDGKGMKTSDLIRKLNTTNNIKPTIIKTPNIETIEIQPGETTEEVINKEVEKIFIEAESAATLDNIHQVKNTQELDFKITNLTSLTTSLNIMVKQQNDKIAELQDKVEKLESDLAQVVNEKGVLTKVIKKWL